MASRAETARGARSPRPGPTGLPSVAVARRRDPRGRPGSPTTTRGACCRRTSSGRSRRSLVLVARRPDARRRSLLVPLLALPTAGLFRVTTRIARGEAVSFWDAIDAWRDGRSARRSPSAPGSSPRSWSSASNVVTGLVARSPLGWALATLAAWGLARAWLYAWTAWPILVDPTRAAQPVAERARLAGLLVLAPTRPDRRPGSRARRVPPRQRRGDRRPRRRSRWPSPPSSRAASSCPRPTGSRRSSVIGARSPWTRATTWPGRRRRPSGRDPADPDRAGDRHDQPRRPRARVPAGRPPRPVGRAGLLRPRHPVRVRLGAARSTAGRRSC